MYRAKQRKNMVVISENEIAGRNSAQEILLQDKTRLTILIVDDSEMNRCILSEMLGADYDILAATNGEEAIKLLRQYKTGISLVLLDLVMPVMDGFGVLSYMNERNCRLYTSGFIIPLLCMRNREDFWFLSQIRFTRKKRIIV